VQRNLHPENKDFKQAADTLTRDIYSVNGLLTPLLHNNMGKSFLRFENMDKSKQHPGIIGMHQM